MNYSIATRLLWKEYRMQRGLWFAMLVAMLVLIGAIRVLAFDATFSTTDQQHFVGMCFGTSMMLTFCYAVGSGALTFAIEREESTQVRLLAVAAPPGLTISIKMAFGIVMSLMLLMANFGIGLTIAGGVPDQFIHKLPTIPIQLMLLMPVILITGFSWAVMCSLLSRVVLVALGLAAVLILFVGFTGTGAAAEISRPAGSHDEAMATVAVALCLAQSLGLGVLNYFLTRRWLSHEFEDRPRLRWRPFQWFVSARSNGGLRIEVGGDSGEELAVLSVDEAIVQRPPRAALGWLNSYRGSPWWRLQRSLIWKEAADTRRLFLGFLGAVLILTTLLARTLDHPHGGDAGLICFVMYGVVLSCGVMTFRQEQDRQAFRFLTCHGASPGSVWLSKHAVWLPRAAGSILLMLLAGFLFAPSEHSLARFIASVFSFDPQPIPKGLFDADTLGGLTRGLICLLVTYAAGQSASQGLRQGIVAWFIGFFAALLIVGWGAFCLAWSVPMWCSILPMFPGLLLQSRRRTRRWLLEQNSQKSWIESHLTVVASLAVCVVAPGLFRVFEVPVIDPVVEQSASGEVLINGLTAAQRVALLAEPTVDEVETTEIAATLAKLITRRKTVDYRGFPPDDSTVAREQELHREWIQNNQNVLARLPELTSRTVGPVRSEEPTEQERISSHLFSLFQLTVADAERLQDGGDLTQALNRYEQAFVLGRFAESAKLHSGAGGHSSVASGLRKRFQLRTWSARKGITQELFERATKLVRSDQSLSYSVDERLFVNHRVIERRINSDATTIYRAIAPSDGQPMPFWASMLINLPGDRSRNLRLLRFMENEAAQLSSEYRQSRKRPGTQWLRRVATAPALRSQASNSPVFRGLYDIDVEQLIDADIWNEADARATILVMKLNLALNESGAYPATLEGLDEGLKDPWSGESFQWFPKGLPHDLTLPDRRVLAAGTSFLWSPRNLSWSPELP